MISPRNVTTEGITDIVDEEVLSIEPDSEMVEGSQVNEIDPKEIEEVRREVGPIFDERFVTLGHGTRLDAALSI